MTREQNAVAKVLGYEADAMTISNACHQHNLTTTKKLRSQLLSWLREFRAAGGRGVDLAEDIDNARITLAVRRCALRPEPQWMTPEERSAEIASLEATASKLSWHWSEERLTLQGITVRLEALRRIHG